MDHYRHFFNLSTHVLCTITDKGYFQQVNPAFEMILGYSADDLRSIQFLDLVQSQDDIQNHNVVHKLASGKSPYQFESYCRCKNGDYRWIEWILQTVPEEPLIYAAGRDVTKDKLTQAALHLRQQEFQAIVEHSPDNVARFDASLRHIYVNPALERDAGISANQFIGKTNKDLGFSEQLSQFLDSQLQLVLDTGQEVRAEFAYDTPVGLHYFETRLAPEFDVHGKVGSVLSITRDITDRKQTEIALRESQERLELTLRGARLGMWDWSISDGSVVFNERWAEMLGYTLNEIEPNVRTWERLVHPDDMPFVMSQLNGHMNGQSPTYEAVHRLKCKSGEWKWVLDSGQVLERDSEGNPLRAVGIHLDINELKQTEEQLRQSEEKFRRMIEAASEGVVLIKLSGEVVLVNQYIEQSFGYSREQLVGQSIHVLIPTDVREQHQQYHDSYVHDLSSWMMEEERELHARRADGSTFPIEISLSPIEVDNQTLIMILLVDTTTRKQLESQRLYARTLELELKKERELIELKERFTSTVSHEFRTPLAIIHSSVDILRRYSGRLGVAEVLERLDRISDQVEHMLNMMEDVLEITRGNAKRIIVDRQPLALLPFCMSIVEQIQLTLKTSHKFALNQDDSIGMVLIDKRLVEHVLMNLLTNAAKYSSSESTITLDVTMIEGQVVFRVEDAGIGIPEEDQQHLFQPFYRAGNAKAIKGTGLGLAIVKQYVEANGGTITFKTLAGKGTVFLVKIPV